jgi:hypothetical protein
VEVGSSKQSLLCRREGRSLYQPMAGPVAHSSISLTSGKPGSVQSGQRLHRVSEVRKLPPKGTSVCWALVPLTEDKDGLHTKVFLEARTRQEAISLFNEQYGCEKVAFVGGGWESEVVRD